MGGGVPKNNPVEKNKPIKEETRKQAEKQETKKPPIITQAIPPVIPDDPVKFCRDVEKIDRSDPSIISLIITILSLLLSMLSNKTIENKTVKKTLEKLIKEEENKKQAC